jgi:hypothetical protein
MTDDLITPAELQQRMLAKSAEIDQAISEYRGRSTEWVNANRAARIAVNTALLSATGANAQERKAKAELASEELIYVEEMADALKTSALEALRARREQLNALNALAYTIRTEMQLAR